MRASAGRQRWALSFADLSLLLLGFFVLLQAKPDAGHLSTGLRAAFGAREESATVESPARAWFLPGEALLQPAARRALADVARRNPRHVTVSSRGTETGSARFDGWELAAARTAAVARALGKSGIAADHIAVAIDPATGGGQTIRVSSD